MEEEKILENISKSITERLKIPIVATYICVLVLYNWDIIYYLIFEYKTASVKIKFIKEEYGPEYYIRILICLTISVALIILFTTLNTSLNFCLKWFYKKDKEITSEVESYEKIKTLTEQLSNSIDEIKNLNSQIENLKNINENLASKNKKIDISEISKKDYELLFTTLNKRPNKEKLLYSLNELVIELKNNEKVNIQKVYKNATYEHDMRNLVELLFEMKLLSGTRYMNVDNSSSYDGVKLGTSFKDFIKMDL
jgi:hypothetical protein